jgi:putative transposase
LWESRSPDWGEEVTQLKGKRHTPEQVVRKLREADRMLAEGADVDAVCRHLEVSVQTYQRWRSQFKSMRPEDVVRLKQLEKENARLKRIVGDQALDIDMLREVARGNF